MSTFDKFLYVITAVNAGMFFGLWQHSVLAGIFMFSTLMLPAYLWSER